MEKYAGKSATENKFLRERSVPKEVSEATKSICNELYDIYNIQPEVTYSGSGYYITYKQGQLEHDEFAEMSNNIELSDVSVKHNYEIGRIDVISKKLN